MLSPQEIYLIFPILGAILGAMLWLNYLKKIDVFEHERNRDLILAFIIGYLSPSLTLYIYLGMEITGFNFNGHIINDFVYSIIGVGLTEEFTKLLGVLIVFKLLKKRINEPVDYLIYASVVALGFSIRENFIYYNNYGSQIITGRTLISCLTHIINTSICVYGIYRYTLFQKGNKYINTVAGLSIAILSHGLFDFFLTENIIGPLTPTLATIIYLIGINFWVQMLNNCINFSPFFNYQKIVTTSQLYKHILIWYSAMLILEFNYAFYYKDWLFAAKDLIGNLFKEGLLLLIVALRISRLKIDKRKYFPIKIQSPIYFTKNEDEDFSLFGTFPLKIRGENTYEFRFLQYMGKEITVCPLSKENSVIKTNHKARLLKKYFLVNDVVIYLIEIFNENNTKPNIYLLKPKMGASKLIDTSFFVATLMQYKNSSNFHKEFESMSYKNLQSIEEVYLKY